MHLERDKIEESGKGYKKDDWHLPRLTNELQALGLEVSLFDIEFESAELLLDYDVIEINGGNPFYLLSK